jgi:hypothetical protein
VTIPIIESQVANVRAKKVASGKESVWAKEGNQRTDKYSQSIDKVISQPKEFPIVWHLLRRNGNEISDGR